MPARLMLHSSGMDLHAALASAIGRALRAARRPLIVRTLTGVLLGASSMGLAGCNPQRDVSVRPQPVQVMAVRLEAGQSAWSYVGVVRPRYESDLGFRVAGKIVTRLVDVGQSVEAGQPLARLDQTDLRLSLQSQEADLRAARSSRDQAVAAEARSKALLERGYLARAVLDQRIAAADEARSRVERAERALSLAHNQLDYTELRADKAGVVSALPVEVGQVVAAGQLVARVARLDALEAQVEIPEQMVGAVKAADATVSVWSEGAREIPVRFRELSPEADRVSRTFQARFAIPAEKDIRMGRTVTVHLRRAEDQKVARIPLAAVMNDGAGAAVWLVDAQGEHVRRTPVDVQAFGPVDATIASGLGDGDRVVTLGVHMLDAGKPVRIVERRADAR